MRKFNLCLLTLTVVMTACGSRATPTPLPPTAAPLTAAPLIPITYAMGYIPDVQFAPFYVAKERGYFAAEGIDITFETMFENDSAPLIGANTWQFGTISAEQVLQARAQGLPLVYVAAWYQQFPIAIVVRDSLGLATPADLRGQRIGLPGLYGASYIGLRALLKHAGVAESDVTLEAIDFNQVALFSAGEADIVVGYANNEPVQLAANGQAFTTFKVADYVRMAANGMVTNEQTIRDHPELVRGMVSALLGGLAETIADPDTAYTIATQYVDGLSTADAATTATQKQVLAASIELWKADHLGYADPAGWEATQNVLLDMGLLTTPLDLNRAYTNEFVP